MSATVSHGSDAERLDEIAERLSGLGDRTAALGGSGSALLSHLDGHWSGQDLVAFERSWSSGRAGIESAADMLRRLARALLEQAEQQRRASSGPGGTSGLAWPAFRVSGAPIAGAQGAGWLSTDLGQEMGGDPPNDEMPDDNDARDGSDRPSWYFDDRTDPGRDDVTLPEGADPDHPAIKELLKTEQGRETLDWMARNEITIVYDEDKKGASYRSSTNTMTIGSGYEDATTIIHEASHARWDAEDLRADPKKVSREDYVEMQIANEVDAQVEEIKFMEERREQNWFAYRFGSYPNWGAYNDAYDAVIENGGSEAQADQAGRAAIRRRFEEGEIVTSSTGEPYTKYYEEQWEDNQR